MRVRGFLVSAGMIGEVVEIETVAGRKLQENYGQRPQVVLTMPILVGTDGHMRMSKTTGNTIGIDDPPKEMYGKVMSIPDGAMLNYYTLVTYPLTGRIKIYSKKVELPRDLIDRDELGERVEDR